MFPKIKIKRFFIGMILGAIVLFLLAQTPLGGLFLGRSTQGQETVRAVKKDLQVTVAASGTLSSGKAVLRFQAPGKVVWVGIKEGDAVVRGRGLASLDTTKSNADYQRALWDLQAAQATLDRVYDEVKDHATDETFALKETRVLAEVAKNKAYEAVIKTEKDLKDATLIAPFTGVIADISEGIVAGANTGATDSITIVGNDLKFEALVDEVDYRRIKKSERVTVRLDAFPEEAFTGEVVSVVKVAEKLPSGATVIPIEIRLSKSSQLIVGLSGEAEFVIEEKKNVIVIPQRALRKSNGDSFVLILQGRNQARRDITIGLEGEREIEVVEGLNEGDLVIIGGAGNGSR